MGLCKGDPSGKMLFEPVLTKCAASDNKAKAGKQFLLGLVEKAKERSRPAPQRSWVRFDMAIKAQKYANDKATAAKKKLSQAKQRKEKAEEELARANKDADDAQKA